MLASTVAAGACRTEDPAQTPVSSAHSASLKAAAVPLVPEPASPSDHTPALTREEVRLVIRAKIAVVRSCFAAGLTLAPELGGRVLLAFTIDAQGHAGGIEIIEDELGESVAPCLREALASWQFPLPRDGRSVAVRYPFVFSSEQALRAADLPRVEGTVKPKAVGAVFDAHRARLDECIPEQTQATLSLAFTLDEHGRVTAIAVYETTLDEHSAACVARSVSSWRFPPTAAGDEARVNHDLRW